MAEELNGTLELDDDVLGLLDRELDDIEDLPGFECPVDGQYLLTMKMALKEVSNRPAVEVGYEVMDTLKKDNEEDTTTVAGTKFSQLCFLKPKPGGDAESVKYSIDQLKKLTKPIAQRVGEGNLLKLITEHLSTGMIVSAKVVGKTDKENPEIRRPRVSGVQPQ